MAGSSSDVFLSYKAEDRPRLKPLVAALEAEGFSVWWDARIGAGSNWRQDIEQHLAAAKCVIVAWSKHSTGPEGEFVRDEASRARRLGTYLPIRIDAVEPPLGFGEIQALPLNGWRRSRDDPRFQALADAVRAQLAGKRAAAARMPIRSRAVSRRAAIAGGIAAAAGIGGAALLLRPAGAPDRRIAVMPFANLSGDPRQAYFSDGMAEELRAALQRLGLEVIGRDSTEAVKSLDSHQAAAKLHVGNILTGSIRSTPDKIRVSAQLVRGSDGVERWSQVYDRAPGDAISIQSDIAQSVAQALNVALGGSARAALQLGATSDEEAQRLYLQARKMLREDSSPAGITAALQLADQAIGRDPRFARAYVVKAQLLSDWASNYVFSPSGVQAKFRDAEEAAQEALRLAPQLGAGEAVLSDIKAKTLDLNAALQHAEAALETTIDDADVLWPVIDVLAYTADPQRALDLTAKAISLDPLSGRGFAARAGVLNIVRRYPEALAAGRKAISLAPKLGSARYYTAQALALTGHYAEANQVMAVIPPHYTFRRLFVAIGAARTGNPALAEQTLAAMRAFDGDVSNYQYAQIETQLGKTELAFAALDRAYAMHDPGLERLKTDAFLDPIRSDRRFARMLDRLRFPPD